MHMTNFDWQDMVPAVGLLSRRPTPASVVKEEAVGITFKVSGGSWRAQSTVKQHRQIKHQKKTVNASICAFSIDHSPKIHADIRFQLDGITSPSM